MNRLRRNDYLPRLKSPANAPSARSPAKPKPASQPLLEEPGLGWLLLTVTLNVQSKIVPACDVACSVKFLLPSVCGLPVIVTLPVALSATSVRPFQTTFDGSAGSEGTFGVSSASTSFATRAVP